MNPILMERAIRDALDKLNQSNAALRRVLDDSDDPALNDALEAVLAADRTAAEELRRRGQALYDEISRDALTTRDEEV